MKRLIILAVLINMAMLYTVAVLHARQTQPDQKRVREIQAALVAHGFEPGRSWPETQKLLRDIARSHHWQTHRAPDARVLILLGLGNKYSDPDVLLEEHNRLDGGNDEQGTRCNAFGGI
jgi:hypothetical protein